MCVRFVEKTGRFLKRGLRNLLRWVYGDPRTNGRIWHYEDRATGKPARESQIGKRDRRMITSRMPKRVISTMLAAVLAITLIPSEVLPEAYAEPQNGDVQTSDDAARGQASSEAEQSSSTASDAAQSADVAADGSASADPSATAGDAAAQRPASVVSATERIADGAPAKADVEMTRVSVSLASGADGVQAVFSQGPLSFQVNADDPATAAVVGIDAHTDATDLVIPAEVVLSGEVYPVTRIIGGGGSVL